MKFLCVDCDEQMTFYERKEPGDGTFAAGFACPTCGRKVALLANPMESRLVGALGVKIGGRTLDAQPMEATRSSMVGRDDAFVDETAARPGRGPVRWSPGGVERLSKVPNFVRGMVKRIYNEWASEHGITEITPEVMDKVRTDLGLGEGM